jgi:ATP synthase protein I
MPEPPDASPASRVRLIPPLKTKPIRTVLRWQMIATVAAAAIAGAWVGWHGALSALLGGFVNVSAGVAYALILGLGVTRTTGAGMSLVAMFRAEGVKILLIIGQLWLVLSLYKDVVPAAFFSAFVLTVVIFSMAIAVRD